MKRKMRETHTVCEREVKKGGTAGEGKKSTL